MSRRLCLYLTLSRVKDSPDADASLTLLADVQGLKGWLNKESVWGLDDRAKAALTKLDMVLVACDKKEAKRLSQVGGGSRGEGGVLMACTAVVV